MRGPWTASCSWQCGPPFRMGFVVRVPSTHQVRGLDEEQPSDGLGLDVSVTVCGVQSAAMPPARLVGTVLLGQEIPLEPGRASDELAFEDQPARVRERSARRVLARLVGDVAVADRDHVRRASHRGVPQADVARPFPQGLRLGPRTFQPEPSGAAGIVAVAGGIESLQRPVRRAAEHAAETRCRLLLWRDGSQRSVEEIMPLGDVPAEHGVVAVQRRIHPVVGHVEGERQSLLAQVAPASGRLGGGLGPRQGRQQERRQHHDDRDHDEQFDQRETAAWMLSVLAGHRLKGPSACSDEAGCRCSNGARTRPRRGGRALPRPHARRRRPG